MDDISGRRKWMMQVDDVRGRRKWTTQTDDASPEKKDETKMQKTKGTFMTFSFIHHTVFFCSI